MRAKLASLFVCCAALSGSGCQTLRGGYNGFKAELSAPPQRKLYLENRWVRSTTNKDYLGYRRRNAMVPLVTEQQIFSGNAIDGLVAFERKSGNQQWRFVVPGGVEAGAALLEDRLYFGGNDGNFYCVNAKTGQEVWRFAIRFEGLGAPLIVDKVVYFLAGNNVAYALDTAAGKQIWSYTRTENSNFTIRGGARPTLVGQVIYFGFSDGTLSALNVSDGSVLWERQLSQNQRFKDVDATPVVDGDRLYISNYDGTLYCLSRADGQILWRFEDGSSESVTVSENKIYFGTTSRKLVSLAKDTGKLVWSVDLKNGLPTQPVIYQGYLIVGSHDGPLEVRQSQDGQEVLRFFPGQGIAAAPSVYGIGGEIYFISNDANLYAMNLVWRNPQNFWPWEQGR